MADDETFVILLGRDGLPHASGPVKSDEFPMTVERNKRVYCYDHTKDGSAFYIEQLQPHIITQW